MKFTHQIAAVAIAVVVGSPAYAQGATAHANARANTSTATKRAQSPSLESQARISEDSARVLALRKVPSGSRITEAELEREKGTVVYSFDIKVPAKDGVEEVLISAIDGAVVWQGHESAAAEKAEAAKEKKDAAKKP